MVQGPGGPGTFVPAVFIGVIKTEHQYKIFSHYLSKNKLISSSGTSLSFKSELSRIGKITTEIKTFTLTYRYGFRVVHVHSTYNVLETAQRGRGRRRQTHNVMMSQHFDQIQLGQDGFPAISHRRMHLGSV